MHPQVLVPPESLYRTFVNKAKSVRFLSVLIKLLNPGRRVEINAISRSLFPSFDDIALDVGCGDGFWTNHFSRNMKNVVGIDPYEPDLLNARKYAASNTEFILGTCENLCFADASFSKVISICVFEHFHSDIAALKEIHRVLKPGGSLLITVDSLDSKFVSDRHRVWHMRAFYCTQLYSVDSITSKVTDAGFRNVEAYYIMGKRLSVFWEILSERVGAFAFLLAPVVYPIILTIERRRNSGGYKIFLKAVK